MVVGGGDWAYFCLMMGGSGIDDGFGVVGGWAETEVMG